MRKIPFNASLLSASSTYLLSIHSNYRYERNVSHLLNMLLQLQSFHTPLPPQSVLLSKRVVAYLPDLSSTVRVPVLFKILNVYKWNKFTIFKIIVLLPHYKDHTRHLSLIPCLQLCSNWFPEQTCQQLSGAFRNVYQKGKEGPWVVAAYWA